MLTLNEPLRVAVEHDLQAIVGWPLVEMYRYGSQAFVFDAAALSPEEAYTDAAWILVAHNRWRIEGADGFALADTDFEPERHDEHAAPFYRHLEGEEDPLLIERIGVLPDGALSVGLSHGFALSVAGTTELDGITAGELGDIWRMMPSYSDPRGQIILYRDEFGWSGLTPDKEAAT